MCKGGFLLVWHWSRCCLQYTVPPPRPWSFRTRVKPFVILGRAICVSVNQSPVDHVSECISVSWVFRGFDPLWRSYILHIFRSLFFIQEMTVILRKQFFFCPQLTASSEVLLTWLLSTKYEGWTLIISDSVSCLFWLSCFGASPWTRVIQATRPWASASSCPQVWPIILASPSKSLRR